MLRAPKQSVHKQNNTTSTPIAISQTKRYNSLEPTINNFQNTRGSEPYPKQLAKSSIQHQLFTNKLSHNPKNKQKKLRLNLSLESKHKVPRTGNKQINKPN